MKSILIFIAIVNCLFLQGQRTPFFLTTFYFEDAVGNRDSMEIGIDTGAMVGFNPEFSEKLNIKPLNNVFDVRAVSFLEHYLSAPPVIPPNLIVKRFVGNAEKVVNAPCYGGEPIIFFIHAIHQPITVRVKNVNDFKEIDCQGHNTWNFFSPDFGYHLLFPWEWVVPGTRYGCIQDTSYTLYLGKGLHPPDEKPYILEYEIEGKGIDSIFGLCFVMDHTFYFCDSTFVSTKEYPSDDIYIYPNPLNDYFQIRFESQMDPERISIYNQSGLQIKSSRWNVYSQEKLLNTTELDNGVYYLKIEFKNRPATYKKLIKI